jgi:hypothetical protein
MHFLISALLAAGPVEWVPAAQLEELQCVREWMELCSMRKPPFPILRISTSKVVVVIDMERGLTLDVKGSARTRTLTAVYDGTPVKATLRADGAQLVWKGVDPTALVDGDGVQEATMRFVKSAEIEKIVAPLVKKFVPGGVCEGLGAARPDPSLPCLNTPKK